MSEWESNSKGDSGGFNPPIPNVSNGTNTSTGSISENVRNGPQGERIPSSTGAEVNGTSSGYDFPRGSALGASMPWETNSSDRK